MTIKLAYLSKSSGGASAVNFVFETKNGKTMRQTIYITNKAGEIFYTSLSGPNKGKKVSLPGYSEVDTICKMAVGKSLAEVHKSVAKKKIMLRDFTQGKDVPTDVEMLMDLVNKGITLGIKEVKENKQTLINGKYQPTNDSRTINEIHKVYSSERFTAKELESKASEPAFANAWLEKYQGQLFDNYKPVTGNSNSTNTTTSDDLFA